LIGFESSGDGLTLDRSWRCRSSRGPHAGSGRDSGAHCGHCGWHATAGRCGVFGVWGLLLIRRMRPCLERLPRRRGSPAPDNLRHQALRQVLSNRVIRIFAIVRLGLREEPVERVGPCRRASFCNSAVRAVCSWKANSGLVGNMGDLLRRSAVTLFSHGGTQVCSPGTLSGTRLTWSGRHVSRLLSIGLFASRLAGVPPNRQLDDSAAPTVGDCIEGWSWSIDSGTLLRQAFVGSRRLRLLNKYLANAWVLRDREHSRRHAVTSAIAARGRRS
jgi:hypothetical protein